MPHNPWEATFAKGARPKRGLTQRASKQVEQANMHACTSLYYAIARRGAASHLRRLKVRPTTLTTAPTAMSPTSATAWKRLPPPRFRRIDRAMMAGAV